jgi:Sulfotransferase family
MKTHQRTVRESLETRKVLMVIGVGRSGSTVLDIVLGGCPEIESVGELTNIARLGWIKDEYCACGRRVGQCPYWSEVRRRLEEEVGPFDPAAYLRLQDRFERARRLPRLSMQRRRPSPEFLAYGRQTRAIYEAIGQTARRRIIVDSSKNPVRALALSRVPGLDIHVLHLIRNANGVTWSLRKAYRRDDAGGVQRDMPPRPAWRTALLWTWGNALAEWVAGRFPPERRGVLTYEAFLADPAEALTEIGRQIGVDLSGLGARAARGDAMAAGHTIAGNRLRMQGSVRLSPDVEWKERMSSADRTVVRAIAGPLMSHYGYER